MIKSIGVYSSCYASNFSHHYRYYVDLLRPIHGHASFKCLRIFRDPHKADHFARQAAKRLHCVAFTLDKLNSSYSDRMIILAE